jgi:hypothetical protein
MIYSLDCALETFIYNPMYRGVSLGDLMEGKGGIKIA